MEFPFFQSCGYRTEGDCSFIIFQSMAQFLFKLYIEKNVFLHPFSFFVYIYKKRQQHNHLHIWQKISYGIKILCIILDKSSQNDTSVPDPLTQHMISDLPPHKGS